jgi:hypothetical protein
MRFQRRIENQGYAVALHSTIQRYCAEEIFAHATLKTEYFAWSESRKDSVPDPDMSR